MGRKLATAVHLTENGVVHSFLPGTKPPKWARERITNPKAWAVDEEPDLHVILSVDAEKVQQGIAKVQQALGEAANDAATVTVNPGVDDTPAGDDDSPEDENDTTVEGGDADDEPTDEIPELTPPPKSGKGSGLDAWRAYADANGFETDEDITRDEIIAALNADNIPTE